MAFPAVKLCQNGKQQEGNQKVKKISKKLLTFIFCNDILRYVAEICSAHTKAIVFIPNLDKSTVMQPWKFKRKIFREYRTDTNQITNSIEGVSPIKGFASGMEQKSQAYFGPEIRQRFRRQQPKGGSRVATEVGTRSMRSGIFIREFDPGSGWTLAACLTHASRTGLIFLKRPACWEWKCC